MCARDTKTVVSLPPGTIPTGAGTVLHGVTLWVCLSVYKSCSIASPRSEWIRIT